MLTKLLENSRVNKEIINIINFSIKFKKKKDGARFIIEMAEEKPRLLKNKKFNIFVNELKTKYQPKERK